MHRLNQYQLIGHATFGRNRKPKHYSVTLAETSATESVSRDTLDALARKAIAASNVRSTGPLMIVCYDVERRDDGIDIFSGFGRAPIMTVQA